MVKEVIGIAGLSQSGKSIVSNYLQRQEKALVLDHQEILAILFKPGEEGHRQIINYFGEEFLRQNGQLNLRKLWKFVYSDWHKLRILDFVLQPLIINYCQQMIDGAQQQLIIIEENYFIDKNWQKLLTKKVWVDRSFNNLTMDVGSFGGLPLNQILNIQERLYVKPDNDYLFITNNSTLSQFKKTLKVIFSDIIAVEK